MMAGTNAAVPFSPVYDARINELFGDDNLSWYWVHDMALPLPEPGIYVREKTTGEPRP
jgi:hypothetical protein